MKESKIDVGDRLLILGVSHTSSYVEFLIHLLQLIYIISSHNLWGAKILNLVQLIVKTCLPRDTNNTNKL